MQFSETEDTSPSSVLRRQWVVKKTWSHPFRRQRSTRSDPSRGFEVVLHVDALNDGDITEVIIAGTAIAVAKQMVLCMLLIIRVHMPVGHCLKGLENQGDAVMIRCPYHGWDFDISDGHCVTSPDTKLGCFETQIVDDAICVRSNQSDTYLVHSNIKFPAELRGTFIETSLLRC